jgi:hypothetical protein
MCVNEKHIQKMLIQIIKTGYTLKKKINCSCGMLVAHSYHPSYLGGLNQEDCGLRPTQATSFQDSISKNNQSKMG